MRGECEACRNVAAAAIRARFADCLGRGEIRARGRECCEEDGFMIMSAVRSMRVGFGRPYQQIRYPLYIVSTMVDRSFDDGQTADLICGLSTAMASIS